MAKYLLHAEVYPNIYMDSDCAYIIKSMLLRHFPGNHYYFFCISSLFYYFGPIHLTKICL